MKNNRPVIVGVFILLGLAILVVTIFTLGGEKKTFVKSFNVHAIFNDVGGLIKGSNVWFSGVKVGTVKSIGFYGHSQVEVTMSIEENAQSHIPNNAMVKIGSDGLIGNKIVIIYGGDSSMPQIEKNNFLNAGTTMSTDDMLATLQANNQNLLAITKDFKSVSKKIDSGNGTLATLINDPTMANKINKTIDNLQATSLSSKDALFNLQNFSGKLNQPGNSINELVMDTVMYGNIRDASAQLKKAASTLTNFTTNLKTASEKLNQKDNVAGLLLNDSAAAASAKITLKNLETSSKKLDEDLEAVQHNFLLRGFFRKKAKAKQQNNDK